MTHFMSLHGFRGPLQTIDIISPHACLHGPSTVLTVICKPLKTLPPRYLHGPLSTHPHTPTRPGLSRRCVPSGMELHNQTPPAREIVVVIVRDVLSAEHRQHWMSA